MFTAVFYMCRAQLLSSASAVRSKFVRIAHVRPIVTSKQNSSTRDVMINVCMYVLIIMLKNIHKLNDETENFKMVKWANIDQKLTEIQQKM